MSTPSPLPAYVYKIIPTPPPTPIPAEYPLSDLDRKDGFVHLSIASQIPITADLFFISATSMWVLKIRFATNSTFEGKTNWDTPGCPHLYDNFGAADVEDAREFTRQEKKTWREAFETQKGDWLV